MVEIKRPEASVWKVIAVRREREDTVELRFVHGTHPPSSKFDKLTASEARSVACLLLAAADHPIEGRLDFEDDPDKPLFVKRAPSGPVELRLWQDGPYAELSLPTTRRLAHALLAESHPLTPPDDAP